MQRGKKALKEIRTDLRNHKVECNNYGKRVPMMSVKGTMK